MRKAFSMVEIILAAGLFAVFSVGVVALTVQGLEANRTAQEQAIANQFAAEGIETVRSIKNISYANLTDTGATGVAKSGGVWIFSGSNNVFDKYTRVISISSVYRDSGGNIVASGGVLDPDTKKVVSTVSWNYGIARAVSIDISEYLTNFRPKGGMVVYGDNGTTADGIFYRNLDSKNWSWSAPTSTADVDPATTNKQLRAVRLFNSQTRNEKILISRHFNGTSQFIYAQVYNGTTGVWGNVQLLSSWTANTYLNVRNFDGTYLNSGDFMVVFSDNTNIPKMSIWNGISWSAQSSLTSLGGGTEIPTWVRLANRSTSNEVMAAFLTQAQDTITQYWSGNAWSAITTHSTSTFNAGRQGMDFAWSTHTPSIGAITYQTAGGDKTPRVKLFSADGVGSGSWSAQVNGADTAAGGSIVALSPLSTADEFQWCAKDQQASPDITCRKITFAGSTATFITPTNSIITPNTVNGVMVTYGYQYEGASGTPGVIAYSDNTAIPKFKKYNAATSTWDSVPTSIATVGTPGIFQTFLTKSTPFVDDLIILMADSNLDLYSVMWDSINNVMYTTGDGRAITAHGVNGSAVADYWYDFAWDK